ncbi:tripartite tricarboxylate transporter substrate binding protein [Bordetella sp. 15P40C-2]|uniref:Bug family tripartite tricarboxylate transporter substrate binding protein n=1 Tax=Bordetella sp. 15P40C-2 TaxID=2572246 RepID=UPI001323A2F3|nr:tripartite tricarboxylate transporter substrate binding protein [Bordetella sp. 15P40C-2]MVW72371.1 tripartite tricarboxylate transporter substrate binding protein [Bordetella sp. 15P40C-2]
MSISHLTRTILTGAAIACAIASASGHAQSAAAIAGVPTITVGFAPGGAADTTARLYAQALQDQGFEKVLVDNKPGASGRIALNAVKTAAPDGLTMYLGGSPLFTLLPLTYQNLNYDADRDLRPVAALVEIPTAVVAAADAPYNNIVEYVEWAKRQPKPTTLGLATLGSSGHLGALSLNKNHGLRIEPVAYRGAAPMLIDVASQEVSIGWDAVASMMPLYQGGKIKFLGISGTKRLSTLPDVPTIAEQGIPDYRTATSWYGIYVPAATPDATVAALEKAFIQASEDPTLRQRLLDNGLVVSPMPAKAVSQRIVQEREAVRPVVEESGIKMD